MLLSSDCKGGIKQSFHWGLSNESWPCPGFAESAKRQDVYSTNRHGASAMASRRRRAHGCVLVWRLEDVRRDLMCRRHITTPTPPHHHRIPSSRPYPPIP